MFRTNANQDPLAEMQQWIQFMDRAYSRSFGQQVHQAIMPIDLYEHENALFVRAAVPGVNPESVEVTVEDCVLTISAETQAQPAGEGEGIRWFRSELPTGKFTRSVKLPHQLDWNAISAEVNDGIILIKIPGLEALKPRVVQVAVNGKTLKTTSSKKELAASNN